MDPISVAPGVGLEGRGKDPRGEEREQRGRGAAHVGCDNAWRHTVSATCAAAGRVPLCRRECRRRSAGRQGRMFVYGLDEIGKEL